MASSVSQQVEGNELEDSAVSPSSPQGLNEQASQEFEEQEQNEAHAVITHTEIDTEHEVPERTEPPEPPESPFNEVDETTMWEIENGTVSLFLFSEKLVNQTPVEQFPEGFPQAAAMLNADPNYAIFRRFSRVHCRVLLQDQAELTRLEKKLHEYDQRISKNEHAKYILYQGRLPVDRSWPKEAKDLLHIHQRCFHNVKEKLRQYDENLKRYYELRRMPGPSQHAHRNVWRWFYQAKPLVKGQNEHMACIEDLVTLGKGEKDSWMEGRLANALKRNPLRLFRVCLWLHVRSELLT